MSIVNINEQELDQALESYEAAGDERDKWRIRDEEGANRYMRIVRSIDKQAQVAAEMKRKEVERIEGFYDGQIDELNSKAEFFRGLLIDWFNQRRALNPKYQLKTPWGKVTSRRIESPVWQDEAATLAWLEGSGHDELVKVEKSIRKADLKKAMNKADGCLIDPATGEIVPGVAITEKVSVSVKTTADSGCKLEVN